MTVHPLLTVVCMKFGSRYGPEYVNRLANAVRANLREPHRVICLTDDPSGIQPGVETRPIPEFGMDAGQWTNGIWPKLTIFGPGVVEDGAPAIFLDLDILILGDLTKFVERLRTTGGLHIIREWDSSAHRLAPLALRPDPGGNSSVVGWIGGEQDHILADFKKDIPGARQRFQNDQEFITHHAKGRHYWPQEYCVSFKRHCVWSWPLNLVFRHPRPPRGATVVVFHGKPDPTDLLTDDPNRRWGGKKRFGYGGVDWVKDYWRRYGG